MEENLVISINLKKDESHSLVETIAKNIMSNESEFLPLLERLIDMGDSNNSVMEGSLNIEACDVQVSNSEGFVSGTFWSHYFAPCKDMRSENDHEVILDFEIDEDSLSFNIELPHPWLPE